MNWMIVACAVGIIAQALTDPVPAADPKKYNKALKYEKADKATKITEQESQFIKAIEEKFNIQSDKSETKSNNSKTADSEERRPFPAVIAIEIVDDNATKVDSKGKRTIDANLGYGYRTNTGYAYSYFGKPKEEQGKFMIYPYSQQDIPSDASGRPANFEYHQRHAYRSQPPRQYQGKTDVTIQPSKAFELVPVTNEHGTTYEEVGNQNDGRIPNVQIPPQQYHHGFSHGPQAPQSIGHSTLFTTFNGGELSGLSGNFPSINPQQFVNPSQLISNPQFRDAGLTADHLSGHGNSISQGVVPVLVLRIPSSHIRNPQAELYPNLPNNYPFSNNLNQINLQRLVSQYLRQHNLPDNVQTNYGSTLANPINNYQTPSYHQPEPVYTQAHFENAQQYPGINAGLGNYRQPIAQNAAPYPVQGQRIQYIQQHSQIPQPQVYEQSEPVYNVQGQQYPRYQEQIQQETPQSYEPPQAYEQPQSYQQPQVYVRSQAYVQPPIAAVPAYSAPKSQEQGPAFQYVQQAVQQSTRQQYEQPRSAQEPSYQYIYPQQASAATSEDHNTQEQSTQEVDANAHVEGQQQQPEEQSPGNEPAPQYQQVSSGQTGDDSTNGLSYYTRGQAAQQEGNEEQRYYQHGYQPQTVYSAPQYQQAEEQEEEASLPISENYPSKDHTQVKISPNNVHQEARAVQSISYVTPSPDNVRHPYKMLAPQMGYQTQYQQQNEEQTQENPEKEETADGAYVRAVGSQKPPVYPHNYHSHPYSIRPQHHKN